MDFLVPEGGRMGSGAVLVGGGDDGGGRSGGRDGSMGSGGPGLGRNPSKGENLRGLIGVRGLLLRRLGERSLGWKEKPSLMLSSTEGATYVKPRKAWLALSLRAVSSGLSTGVCRVNRTSNWLTSSSDCRLGLKGGSTRWAKRSSQLMCRKNGCLCTSAASPGPPPIR